MKARRKDAVAAGPLAESCPPRSYEAEVSLLGAMLVKPDVIADVLAIVPRAQDLYDQSHASIFQAMLDLHGRNGGFDLVQLQDCLRDMGVYDGVGGEPKLREIAEGVPSAASAVYYAAIVAEKAKLRRLREAATQIVFNVDHAGTFGPEASREIADRAEQAIFDIAQEVPASDSTDVKSLMHAELEHLESPGRAASNAIASGFGELDAMLEGLQPGELIVFAARPSVGKTSWALNLAEQVAVGNAKPVPVGVLSLEMSKRSVGHRLISALSGVPTPKLRSGVLDDMQLKEAMRACGTLANAPIEIDDTASMTVMALRTKARRMVLKRGVKLILIDYLQLVTAPESNENRQVEVAAISRKIKALARELNIPIVCLSQLNRASEAREGQRPRMSDLRESGAIEQDADVIMLLHREDLCHAGDRAWLDANHSKVGVAEVIVAKQRNGPTGSVYLRWDEKRTRFTDLPTQSGGKQS